MKKRKILWSLAALVMATATSVGLSSCGGDDEEAPSGFLNVSQSSVEFTSDGGSQTIMVSSNVAWSVSGNSSWLTVSPSAGTETKSVTLTATENNGKDSRSCTLVFTTADGKGIATVTVNQQKTSPAILVNGLESTTLQFSASSGVSYKQTVRVSSNVSWQISNVPEWLSVSPTSGNGDLTVDIYPKTDNDADDKERTAQLVLYSNEAQAVINISQDSDLDKDAYVTPTNVLTLSDGIAFDYEFGKSVSYYYRGYMEKALVGSMTDAEIIEVLESKFSRYNVDQAGVTSFSGLDEDTDYIIYTLGYNKNGKRGKLGKTEAATKKLQNNEPIAWITTPTADASYWYWNVDKSATCYSYYMITTDDYDFGFANDVYQAWIINYYISNGYISEYVNGGDWYAPREGEFIAVITWGLDKKENFAGKINHSYGWYFNSAPKQSAKRSASARTDANYPIIGRDKLTICKRK